MAWEAAPTPVAGGMSPFQTFNPSTWEGKKPPGYNWIVDGCFLPGTVAMLSGDGGLGKSLLLQQLATCVALGKPWLGMNVRRGRAFAMFCEDDKDELHRRQVRINAHYECGMADLEEDVLFASRVGQENGLMYFDRQNDAVRPAPLFDQVSYAAKQLGASVVILDTVADVFTGNEIIRNQVRRFVTNLRRLALELQGVVILSHHPSLQGMANGTGLSGSTAWNNSVRSRLYLTKKKDGAENERFLKTMKNNQGPWGGKVRLEWQKGVFVRTDTPDLPKPWAEVDDEAPF